MAKGGEWRVERWRGGERPEGEGEGGRRQGGRGGRRGGRRRRKERRRSAGCRERRGGVLSVCPCRHVCRQHLSCVHPAPVSPSSLSIAGHAPLGWTCRRRSGRPSSGPPRPPGSIRIRSVSSPAAVLRGRRPRARWARSAASLSCSVRSGRSSFTHVLAPAEGLPPSTAQITWFLHGIRILLFARVGVYRRFVNGTASATRAPSLASLYVLRGQN